MIVQPKNQSYSTYLRIVFQFLSTTTVNLLNKLSKFAGNVSCMTIKDGRIASMDLTRMIHYDDL